MSMVWTIRGIGILALVAAGLVFARCIADGLHDDYGTGPALAPTAVEQLIQTGSNKNDGSSPLPPLVQQAQAFALYLNPPAPVANPVAQSPVKQHVAVASAAEVMPTSPSPKFELHGISYYRAKPDQSIALVLEPGGMRRWVRPGDQLGHFTIERIDGDSVVCRAGTQTHVMALAPDEAIARFAKSIKSTPIPTQAQRKMRGPEVPPPAPGMRQMPPSRVMAKLGQLS
ncbi:MAG: hypothetical protein A2Y76_00560 [Planctomycetes bacterium RBG_13_60_9]|nr:MAG: hypothetical protein A2Y76_00560 [Planctomycetes bacterium RBG_13_60_9]